MIAILRCMSTVMRAIKATEYVCFKMQTKLHQINTSVTGRIRAIMAIYANKLRLQILYLGSTVGDKTKQLSNWKSLFIKEVPGWVDGETKETVLKFSQKGAKRNLQQSLDSKIVAIYFCIEKRASLLLLFCLTPLRQRKDN